MDEFGHLPERRAVVLQCWTTDGERLLVGVRVGESSNDPDNSDRELVLGETMLIVARLVLQDSIELYVKPDLEDPQPDLVVPAPELYFHSVTVLPGAQPGYGSLDSIRLASSFEALTGSAR